MLCRICLSDVTPLVGIFSEDGLKHQLADKIRICLQIQVQRGDCFPDKVCCKCFMSVNEFFSFWKKARESYNLLQKLQKDVNSKQPGRWSGANNEAEDIVKDPALDILDIIDMETTTANRQMTDVQKQTADHGYMSNLTGENKSTLSSVPTGADNRDRFSSNMPRKEEASRYVQYWDRNPTMQDTKSWQNYRDESPALQPPHTMNDEHRLDSKPHQFISKQFSFGTPSMPQDSTKETQENLKNSWRRLYAEKIEQKPIKVEIETENENFRNSFSFFRKSTKPEGTNSPFQQKALNPDSQQMFPSNDESYLPNIPLSLFSSSDDKQQMPLEIKNSLETKHAEGLQASSPILVTSKDSGFSEKTNDIEMTPRTKVMKMLNREIW